MSHLPLSLMNRYNKTNAVFTKDLLLKSFTEPSEVAFKVPEVHRGYPSPHVEPFKHLGKVERKT